jgi:hypothetical protein
VPALAKRCDASEFLPPLDRLHGQGLKEYPPKVAPEDLGSATCAVVGLLEHQCALPVEDTRGLPTLVDDRTERIGEAGGRERGLPILFMDVELAALCASARRRLGLVDRRGYAVDMKDAGENEPAEAGADGRDWFHRAAAMLPRCWA